MEKELKNWICEVTEKMPGFLKGMRDQRVPGRFKYSLSGDVNQNPDWGLGNTVFGVKSYYMLDKLTVEDSSDFSGFINSFQSANGEIGDTYIQRNSYLRRWIYAFRSMDFNNIWGKQNKRAETRQAFAALDALGAKPDIPFEQIPYTKGEISKYIQSLDWKRPWGAASHFSHLIFFINMNAKMFGMHAEGVEVLLDHAFDELNSYKHDDECWYSDGAILPPFQKINAGMKVMTAYDISGRDDFGDPAKLIDLCLENINDGHACNNFNIVCLLYYCLKKLDYRREEAVNYCLSRLAMFKEFWWEEKGGFSFLPNGSNKCYYGAVISKGLSEPDIHGTHLFLWGIVLISDILGWKDEFGFKFPIT